AAPARAGPPPQDRVHRGRALDRLDRISIARGCHQLLQIRSGLAAAHSRRPARRQAGDPTRADPRYAAARNVCARPPQRFTTALSPPPRRSFLRLHYRSVMAHDRRAPYDYFLRVWGPVPFNDWTLSPLGFLDFIAQDGTCRDPSRPRTMVAHPSL